MPAWNYQSHCHDGVVLDGWQRHLLGGLSFLAQFVQDGVFLLVNWDEVAFKVQEGVLGVVINEHVIVHDIRRHFGCVSCSCTAVGSSWKGRFL